MAVFTNMQRTNLGPLTTTFSAPAACSTPVGLADNDTLVWAAQSCGITGGPSDTKGCWPKATDGAPSPKPPFLGWGFYSPGLICPAGYTSACSATALDNYGWDVQYALRGGETAVGCCPTGYTCTNCNGQTCALVVSSTTIPTMNCPTRTESVLAQVVTRTLPDDALSLSTLTIFAPMIQLNFQSTDLPRSSTSSTPSPSLTPTVPPAIPAAESNNLSTGAIAGISLAGALVAIILAIVVTIIWRRRERLGTRSEEQENLHAHRYIPEMDSESFEPKQQELPGQRYVFEIGDPEVHELGVQEWNQRAAR